MMTMNMRNIHKIQNQSNKNCANCVKSNPFNSYDYGKDWVAFSVVLGGCVGSVFYVNYDQQPLFPPHQEDRCIN